MISYCGWAIALNDDGDETLTVPEGTVGVIDGLLSRQSSSQCTDLQLPEGLRYIGAAAFHEMEKLTGVTLPSSLLRLGDSAFARCTSLVRVNGAPLSMTVGANVFQDTPFFRENELIILGSTLIAYSGMDKETLTIPEGVVSIAYRALADHKELTSVALPRSLTRIGEGAFQGCTALADVPLPRDLELIGPDAFNETGVTEIAIPAGVTALSAWSFSGCESLRSVRLSEGLAEIGEGAFSGCSALEAVTIPRSVTRVGDSAFASSGIKELDLPADVSIGKNAFRYSMLERLTIDGEPMGFLSFVAVWGQALRNTPLQEAIINSWYLEDSASKWYTPQSLTSRIGRTYARQLIRRGEISDVRTAYDWMCVNCGYTYSTGQHVSASDGPFFYGNASCNGVSLAMKCILDELGIANFVMTGYVTGTYGRVSHAWPEVRSGSGFCIVDPTDTEKGDYSTYMVDNNTASKGYRSNGMNIQYEFSWDSLNAKMTACLEDYTPKVVSSQPLTFTRQEDGSFWVSGCQNVAGEVTIPSEYEGQPVTGIGAGAFDRCAFLTGVIIPEGVVSIGDSAFRDCIGLERITLPSTVSGLGSGVFSGCVSLESADLSASRITRLPGGTFLWCVSLMEMKLPDTLISADGMKVPVRTLINSTDGEYHMTVFGFNGSAAQQKAAELGYTFIPMGQQDPVRDAVVLLLHTAVNGTVWPLPAGWDHCDVNGDGTVDQADAFRVLFGSAFPEGRPLDRLVIGQYDSSGRMTGALVLSDEKEAAGQDLSGCRDAAELRFCFLDSQAVPLARSMAVRPTGQS